MRSGQIEKASLAPMISCVRHDYKQRLHRKNESGAAAQPPEECARTGHRSQEPVGEISDDFSCLPSLQGVRRANGVDSHVSAVNCIG